MGISFLLIIKEAKMDKRIEEKLKDLYSSKMDNETFNRYIKVCDLIKGDDIAEQLLNNLTNVACEYIHVVVNADMLLRTQALRLEGEEYRQYVQSLDENRNRKHNALISALHAFNRYLLKEYEDAPKGGIYSLSPDTIRDRVAVGDWAGRFVYEIFVNRKK
jgi:hypothetical protein